MASSFRPLLVYLISASIITTSLLFISSEEKPFSSFYHRRQNKVDVIGSISLCQSCLASDWPRYDFGL